jgi:hypothetical protein
MMMVMRSMGLLGNWSSGKIKAEVSNRPFILPPLNIFRVLFTVPLRAFVVPQRVKFNFIRTFSVLGTMQDVADSSGQTHELEAINICFSQQ